MESRIKGRLLSIIVALAMIASTGSGFAETTKPTHKPSTKSATRVTKKTVTKKKTVSRKKVLKVSPLLSPKWPPAKPFKHFEGPNGEIYYEIPTPLELATLVSADKQLADQLTKCLPNKSACGVVRLGSTNGCKWWQIDSIVYGPLSETDPTSVPYGNLRTTAKATNPKQLITVLLISSEPLKPNVTVGHLDISCYHYPATERVPSNSYTLNTPTPSATPTTNTN